MYKQSRTNRTNTVKSLLGLCMAFALWPTYALGSDTNNVRWKTIIGIMIPSDLVGSGNTKITGGGRPWSTTGGVARINLQNGYVEFVVRGLVLAGGNSIGTPGAVDSVVGTLVCDTNGDRPEGGGNSLVFDTTAVELDAEGDAMFSGAFSQDQLADLAMCSTEAGSDIAFLIRNAASGTPGNWIANGAVLLRNIKS